MNEPPRVFVLQLAGPDRRGLGAAERRTVRRLVESAFQDYALVEAEVVVAGQARSGVLLRLATNRGDEVVHLAERLRRVLRQDALAIDIDGRRHWVTANGHGPETGDSGER